MTESGWIMIRRNSIETETRTARQVTSSGPAASKRRAPGSLPRSTPFERNWAVNHGFPVLAQELLVKAGSLSHAVNLPMGRFGPLL